MQIHRVAVVAAALLVSVAAMGQKQEASQARDVLRASDGGRIRDFELARDEIAVGHRIRPHASVRRRGDGPLATAADVVRWAEAEARAAGEEAALVYYEAGRPRTEATRRVLGRRVAVRLQPGADPAAVAAAAGAEPAGPVAGAPGWHLVRAADIAGAPDLAGRLVAIPGVVETQVQLGRQPRKKMIPNDAFFANQWHLRNTGQGGGTFGIDVNITSVWDSFRGTNLVIAIVDDGLQVTHPDLISNVNTNWDYDWNDASPFDPSPDISNEDFHGTSCAGVAAARGNNTIGVSGAAPEATIVGLRLIAGTVEDADEADALTHSNSVVQIKSNSWGPDDDGITLEGPGTLTLAALSNGVANGRGGRGIIYTWAGGNGLESDDNANKDGYANSPYTIAVGAVADDGTQAYYSEPGACLVVSAPSSGGSTDIYTTDITGTDGYNSSYGTIGEPSNRDYTGTFGGTSSATPLVAGVVALVLQANPELGWRDVQEILIRSARRINPSDADWRTNSVGLAFNHKFGAGLVNASGSVARALSWTNLGARLSTRVDQTGLGLSIPDNNSTGLLRSFNVATNLRVEHVEVTVSIAHTSRGQLEIILTSPSGMESRLIETNADTGNDFAPWTFTSVRHWGEASQGTWTARVADRTSGTVGTLTSLTLSVHGTEAGPPARYAPVFGAIANPAVEAGQAVAVAVTATPTDGDPVTLTASNVPPWASFIATNEAGILSGTPGGADTGFWTVFFRAADTDGVSTASSTIEVVPVGGMASNLLVEYTFDYDGAFTTNALQVAPELTASGFRSADGSLTNYTGLGSTRAVGDIGWTGTVHYFEFTLTPDAGRGVRMIGFRFAATRSGTGPQTWRLTSSADGHAGVLASGTVPAAWRTNEAWFTSAASSVPLVVRLHGENATGAGGTWRVEDVRAFGSVAMTGTADTDGDGITDEWESRHSGTPTGIDALSDDDVDGFTALEEFLADTHPGSSTSRFEVARVVLHGDVAEIGFASSTGRLYSVHLRTNLLDAAGWNSVILDRQGSNGVTTLMHTNTAPVKLYRLNARRP